MAGVTEEQIHLAKAQAPVGSFNYSQTLGEKKAFTSKVPLALHPTDG